MNTSTPPSAPDFEQRLRGQLRSYAAQAPQEVRAVTADATELRPNPDATAPRRRRVAGIGALVIALGGGAALTTVAATGTDGGGRSTPEDAVEAFIDAIEDRDVLGALDVIDPAEGRAMTDVAVRALSESIRVGVLDQRADLAAVEGGGLEISPIELTSEPLADDLAVVSFNAGAIGFDLDPRGFPLGRQVLDQLDIDPAVDRFDGTFDMSNGGLDMATVRRGDQWYVSIGFTIAEQIRADGDPLPLAGTIMPVGSPSPEAAATLFWERLAALDLRGVAATAAPGETDAVTRYASLWLDGAEVLAADAAANDVAIDISELTFERSDLDESVRLRPHAYVIEGTLPSPDAGMGVEDPGLPPFDPEAATIITSFDVSSEEIRFLVLAPGEPLPDTFDLDDFTTDEPDTSTLDQGGAVNTAMLNPDGSIFPFWTDEPAEPAAGLGASDGDADGTNRFDEFRIEHADDCTTVTGSAFDPDGVLGWFQPAGVEFVDDGYRVCGQRNVLRGLSSVTTLLFFRGAVELPELPPLEVVEVDGQWYVSPIRSVAATVLDTLAGVADDGIFTLDSPIAAFLYGADLDGWEQQYVGRRIDDVVDACREMFVVDASGEITAVVNDIMSISLDVGGVQQCFYEAGGGFGELSLFEDSAGN